MESKPIIEFNTENLYLILEYYFSPSRNRVLLEIKPGQAAATEDDIRKAVDLDSLADTGCEINLCVFSNRLADDEPADDYEVVINQGEARYGFCANDTIRSFPLVEGKLTPGIYTDFEECRYGELRSREDLAIIHSYADHVGIYRTEYKLVCREKAIEAVGVEYGVENGKEVLLRRLPVYPFTYFDFYCPVCSRPVVTFETRNDPNRYGRKADTGCEHYVGWAWREGGGYDPKSLDDLPVDYKLENNRLYLMIREEWTEPIVRVPPYDPLNCFWGKDREDGGDASVFLFVEPKNITAGNTNLRKKD